MSAVIYRKGAAPVPCLGLPADRDQNVFTAVRPRGTPVAAVTKQDGPAVSAAVLARRARKNATYHRTQAMKKALRVNPESHICAKADKAKTSKLLGKRNEARSQ